MGARAVIALALAAACAGPAPSAEIVAVTPSPEPGHERALVAVHNAGGQGEVTIEVTLHAQGGRPIRETKTLDMEAHERLSLTIDVPAPAGDYTATVAAKYPD